MKVIIFLSVCVLLAGVSYAQFDHTLRNAAGLALTASSTNPQNGISQFSATVNDQVVGAGCRCNLHSVTNVRTNNGPFNSGSYFEVTLSNPANASLYYYMGPDAETFDIYNILDVLGSGSAFLGFGTCDVSSTTCTFDYYCELYDNVSTLDLVVCSEELDNSDQDAINFYTVGVRQFVANIQTIPASRTLTQSTGVVNTYLSTNPGPSNFVHYYHNLQTTVAEAGARSRLFVQATNWGGATGSAYICVSFNTMVANTDSLSSVNFPSGSDINGENIIPNSVFVNTPDGCTTYCQQGTVSGSSSIVVASFNACDFADCGFPEDIWIGVRTPSASTASTYTVSLVFRSFSIPTLVDISTFATSYDRDITDTCDGDIGDFSCEHYYEVTSRPTAGTGVPGPYLAVNVFGVYKGEVAAYLSDGHLSGTESLCADCPIFDLCNNVGVDANVPDCWMVVQPCDWTTDRDWIITVEGLDQDLDGEAIEYGITVNAGNWPVTSVSATEWETGEPYFDTVKPYHYHHYTVTFEDSDLFDDSYFEVQLYTFHEEDEIGIAWRGAGYADDGTCNGYDGFCTTFDDCSSDLSESNTGYCRFVFLPCPYEVDADEVKPSDDGLKVAQLGAGTYYFAVWGIGDSEHYYTGVEYTLLFNLRRSTPIFDGVILSGRVFEYEYTPQYYLTVPNDPTLLNIVITLSEVNNGDLTLFAKCGALAGDCPCWSADISCTTLDIECSVSLSPCSCPDGIWYFSVFNNVVDESGNGETPFLFGSYTLQAYYEYYPIGEIIPIEVSRSVVTFSGSLSSGYDGVFPDSFDADYFWVSTTNVDPKNDVLALTLTALVAVPSETQSSGVLTVTVAKGGIASPFVGCYPQQSCSVDVNSWLDTSGQLATCYLVFQPCYNPDVCVNEDCSVEESFTALAWDYTDIFYVTVSLDSDLEIVDYTLNAQVINQAPLSLTNGEPFYAYASIDQYIHFEFTLPSGRSANSVLNAKLYSNHDQIGFLELYMHYDNSENPTLAGFSDECYEHDFCDICTVTGAAEPTYCIYEITPCNLNGQTGSYYLSVYAVDIIQAPGQHKPEFTLTVSILEPVPLLAGTIGIEYPDKIYNPETLYYAVTVPTLVTGSIVGRVLNIDVAGVHWGSLNFKITNLIEPFEDCGCYLGAEIIEGELNEWRRYPCELTSGDVYYITVSGLQDELCTPVEYILHARVYDVTEETISLTSVDSVVVGSFDKSGYTIGYNEWHAFRFTTNAVEGSTLQVDITQPFPSGETDIKPIEARLSFGDIATRLGYNGRDGVGPEPNDESCVENVVCAPSDLNNGQTCKIYVDPCGVPEGSTTWFLTFTGEDLLVEETSYPINFSIRLIAPRNVITFPALNDYTTTSTSTSISTLASSINNNYGVTILQTSSNNNGINAGDTVTISYTGTGSVDFYVQYGSETGILIGCPDICQQFNTANPTCTFTACESLSSDTWFIAIDSEVDQTGTVSVRRSQTPTTSITSTTLNGVNTIVNFEALGANQWRYHSLNVPASTHGHYELEITGGASYNDLVFTGFTSSSAVYWPNFVFDPRNVDDEFTIFSDGNVAGTCGGTNIDFIGGTCCYDQDTSVFAIAADQNGLGAYSLEIVFIEFAATATPTSISFPSVTTRTTNNGQVAWYSFNLPADTHFWFELSVTDGSADIYLNKGFLAGSDAVDFNDDFGACWFNDGVFQNQVCPQTVQAGDFCDGFIAAPCYDCTQNNEGSTYYFAVIPANDGTATYSLTIISQQFAQNLNTGNNNNLLFPSTGNQNIKIIDDDVSTTDYSVYSHFTWSFDQSPYDIAQFIPNTDDNQVFDDFTFPHITFTISNVVQLGTSTSAINLVDFYINSGSLAGVSDCYGGRDILQGSNLLPCIETPSGAGLFDSATNTITCSVYVCGLSCGEEIYFSIARAQVDISAVSFAIGITQNYAQVSDEIDIVSVSLSGTGFTSTYSNTQSLNDVVYFRVASSSLPNFLESSSSTLDFIIDTITGDIGSSDLEVNFYSGSVCGTSQAPNICNGLGTTFDLCYIDYDPCATTAFVDPSTTQVFYIRVARAITSATTWGFRIRAIVKTVTPLDASETTFTLDTPDISGVVGSYSAEKEIANGQWHFYEFNVDNGDFGGYNTLELDFANLYCNDQTFDLDLYVSFFEDSDGLINVARPNRWPTRSCFVDSDIDEFTFSIDNWCNVYGGTYRAAVYADYGLQVYEDPVLGTTYPAVYSISFTITANEVPEDLPLNCENDVFSNSYYVVRPDASNRGSRLQFIFDSATGPASLWISKNANPFESFSNCAWGAESSVAPFSTIRGDYYCNTDAFDSCSITIDLCEFSDDTWFIYIDSVTPVTKIRDHGDSISPFTLTILNHRVYTPEITLATTGFSYSTASVVTSLNYQFYNFIVDDTRVDYNFVATLIATSCDFCDVTLFIIEGPASIAAGLGVDAAGNSQACSECEYGNCRCNDASCDTSNSGYCVIGAPSCTVAGSTVTIGIRSGTVPAGSSALCPYILDVTSVSAFEPIEEDIEYCTSVLCNDFYHLVPSDGVSDFTGRIAFIELVNLDATTLTVYYSYDSIATEVCHFDSDICLSGETCTWTLDCNLGDIYFTVANEECLITSNTCAGSLYSLTYTVEDVAISTASVNGNVITSTDIVLVTASSAFYSDIPVSVTGPGNCGIGCQVSFSAGSYYLLAAGASLTTFNTVSLSSSFTSSTFDEDGILFFSVSIPAGVDSVTFEFQDFSSATDSIEYYFQADHPFIPCDLCDSNANYLTVASCDADENPLSFTCLEQTTYYLTLITCSSDVCDQSFRIRSILGQARTLIGTTHSGSYSQLIVPATCSASSQVFRYYTQANGPLYVNLRQIGFFTATSTVTVYDAADACSSDSCGVITDSIGDQSSCGVQSGCSTYSCASGLYYIDVDLSGTSSDDAGVAVELLVVNQWVDLSSSASATLLGSEKHFYRVANSLNALTFKLSVHSGPALRFIVFDGCFKALGTFQETQVCAFGECYIWVPTLAKHSGSANYYVEILSDFGTDEAEWLRNNNNRAEAPTDYTIQVISGSGNCAAPPTGGFCSDASFAGVDVWSDLTNNQVWSFVDPTLHDQEAHCLYEELTDRCVYPTDECRYWLKVFSCLESFPQCDSTGFQQAPCVDVCNKVEEVCGSFDDASNFEYPFQCCRDRYSADSTGTCFNIPPPPPPPPSFETNDTSVESSYPPAFEVPVFPTIYATMPPASEFYTFTNFKDVEIEDKREIVVEKSPASQLTVFVSFVVLLVALLI